LLIASNEIVTYFLWVCDDMLHVVDWYNQMRKLFGMSEVLESPQLGVHLFDMFSSLDACDGFSFGAISKELSVLGSFFEMSVSDGVRLKYDLFQMCLGLTQ